MVLPLPSQAVKNGAVAIIYEPVGEFKKIVDELEEYALAWR